MSFLATRVFRGCRSVLFPASQATSSSIVSFSSSATSKSIKKPAAKTKAKAKPKTKSESPVKKTTTTTPRITPFSKITPVTPPLAQFLGTAETSRTGAVKEIWSYIKSHDLQNPSNKREILCDEKLKTIFEGKDKVGFLEVSKLLSQHFVKTA